MALEESGSEKKFFMTTPVTRRAKLVSIVKFFPTSGVWRLKAGLVAFGVKVYFQF
jgi:hypothetical protein